MHNKHSTKLLYATKHQQSLLARALLRTRFLLTWTFLARSLDLVHLPQPEFLKSSPDPATRNHRHHQRRPHSAHNGVEFHPLLAPPPRSTSPIVIARSRKKNSNNKESQQSFTCYQFELFHRCRWLDAERSEPQHRRISARDVSVACLFMFRVRPGCFQESVASAGINEPRKLGASNNNSTRIKHKQQP